MLEIKLMKDKFALIFIYLFILYESVYFKQNVLLMFYLKDLYIFKNKDVKKKQKCFKQIKD